MDERMVYLAGGCFWGVEAYLRRLDGVMDTECGYANGHVNDPGYARVCQGDTGHTETVRICYDVGELPLARLLEEFFSIIDPCAQAPVQYQSGVYYEDAADAEVCAAALDALAKAQEQALAVQMCPLTCFFPAEDYHQDYMEKHPDAHCHVDLSRFGRLAAR